jgi:hypothetical protein
MPFIGLGTERNVQPILENRKKQTLGIQGYAYLTEILRHQEKAVYTAPVGKEPIQRETLNISKARYRLLVNRNLGLILPEGETHDQTGGHPADGCLS